MHFKNDFSFYFQAEHFSSRLCFINLVAAPFIRYGFDNELIRFDEE
jgi:hypothetical protein